MRVEVSERERRFISTHRVGRLSTADASGRPHVVPVCYAYDGEHIYTAVDRKPKRVAARRLKRVRNVLANPRVALIIDDYSEDWSRLAYVLVQGSAVLLEDGQERARAESLLRDKYPQYRDLLDEGCPVLRITTQKIVSWGRVAGGKG